MGVSIITAVKRFAAHFASKRFHAGMNSNMLFIMFGIHEGGIAGATLIRPFTSMCCFNMIFKKPPTLERSRACVAFVPFIIEMCGPFV